MNQIKQLAVALSIALKTPVSARKPMGSGRWLWISASCAALSLVAACHSPTPKPQPPPGLTVQAGQFYRAGKPYRAVGVNYYDLFTRLAAKPENESSLQGLAQLAQAGVPFARFNAGGYSATDWARYLANKEAHFAQMDRVVQAAEQNHIGLIPSLFWSTFLNETVDEHKQAWGDRNSRTLAIMRDYTREVVTRYKTSPAILAWEFGNEWNLYIDLPNAADLRRPGEDANDDLKSTQLAVALAEFAAAVRAVDSTRPLITGHSLPRPAAWNNTENNSWKADTLEQWRAVLPRQNPLGYDTVSIHIYADEEVSKLGGQWTKSWADYLKQLKAYATETRRPLFIGEFGLASNGKFTPEQVKTGYRELIPAMEAAKVDLAAVWVFDLPAQNKDWNITFDNDRAYMLTDVIEANRRWSEPK